MNPMIGSRLQQRLRRQSGVNRRGGEMPRGRNMTCSVARTGRCRCSSEHAAGVDGLIGDPMEGTSRRRRYGVTDCRNVVEATCSHEESTISRRGSNTGGETDLAKEVGGRLRWRHPNRPRPQRADRYRRVSRMWVASRFAIFGSRVGALGNPRTPGWRQPR